MKSEVDQIPENGNDKNTGQANEALQAGHLVSAHDSSLFPIDGQSGSDGSVHNSVSGINFAYKAMS